MTFVGSMPARRCPTVSRPSAPAATRDGHRGCAGRAQARMVAPSIMSRGRADRLANAIMAARSWHDCSRTRLRDVAILETRRWAWGCRWVSELPGFSQGLRSRRQGKFLERFFGWSFGRGDCVAALCVRRSRSCRGRPVRDGVSVVRESVDAKARRYLGEGLLTVRVVDRDHVRATCAGRRRYDLGWDRGAGWWCGCPASAFRRSCVHVRALQLVTVARGGDVAEVECVRLPASEAA